MNETYHVAKLVIGSWKSNFLFGAVYCRRSLKHLIALQFITRSADDGIVEETPPAHAIEVCLSCVTFDCHRGSYNLTILSSYIRS